jgi:FkbM family methyltransferase
LRSLGFRNVYLPVEYHDALEEELGVRYWLGSRRIYRNHLDSLSELYALLADEKSKALLGSVLGYRALGRPEDHPVGQPEESYFPLDVPRWSEPLDWVDGGACDGDSLRSFPLDRYRCPNVYAFEPDPSNYEKLQISLRDFQRRSPQTHGHSWPAGLGKEKGILKFKTGLGLGSAASVEGETECSIVRLDDELENRPVNLIKLDIEGAEPDALLGAEEIIRKQKPGLAICIYHTPAHLWEIPLDLAQRHPGYRYYLRCHGQSSFDLVLYALKS